MTTFATKEGNVLSCGQLNPSAQFVIWYRRDGRKFFQASLIISFNLKRKMLLNRLHWRPNYGKPSGLSGFLIPAPLQYGIKNHQAGHSVRALAILQYTTRKAVAVYLINLLTQCTKLLCTKWTLCALAVCYTYPRTSGELEGAQH